MIGFKPVNDVHDIHMYRGDLTGDHAYENGLYQGGGLIFYHTPEDSYPAPVALHSVGFSLTAAAAGPTMGGTPRSLGGHQPARAGRQRIHRNRSMDNLDVVKILGLGVIGLGFLLAFLAFRLLRQEQTRRPPDPAALRSTYVFMGFALLLCLIGIASQVFDRSRISRDEHEKELVTLRTEYENKINANRRLYQVSGRIETPAGGSEVERTFGCAGTVKGVEKGMHLWLAVEVDGSVWPRDRELSVGAGGRWAATVFEDGTGQTFSLCLLVVNEETHVTIQGWLDRGRQKGNFERVSGFVGSARVDRIDGLRLKR